MTVKADDRKRVVLPPANPGDTFDVRVSANGTFILTLLVPAVKQPVRAKVRFEKRGGYTVGVTERPIDMEALKAALSEFP